MCWKERCVRVEAGKARKEVRKVTWSEQGFLEETIYCRGLKEGGEMKQRGACAKMEMHSRQLGGRESSGRDRQHLHGKPGAPINSQGKGKMEKQGRPRTES